MEKIIVIGSPGAGKSTFSRALRGQTGLPLFYLDRLWHKPDRTNVSREEFDAALEGILRLDRWIIDGNYIRTLETSLRACDTVFLLDLPVETCLEGVADKAILRFARRVLKAARTVGEPILCASSAITIRFSGNWFTSCWKSRLQYES